MFSGINLQNMSRTSLDLYLTPSMGGLCLGEGSLSGGGSVQGVSVQGGRVLCRVGVSVQGGLCQRDPPVNRMTDRQV